MSDRAAGGETQRETSRFQKKQYPKRRPTFTRRARAKYGSKVSQARVAALEVVRQRRERDAFARDLITSHIDASSLSREDRAFATRLVLGVTGYYETLNEVLNRALNNPDDIRDYLRDALLISTYEIIYLDKEPHAAVDQGVELVRSFEPRAIRLANAVLRRVAELKPEFPFGDPKTDLATYARLHGMPHWLTKKLVDDLGARAAHDFIAASHEPPPLYIAVNALKSTDREVETLLATAQGEPTSVHFLNKENLPLVPGCFCVENRRVLSDHQVKQALDNGWFLVSDASAQTVAALALPEQKPERFLEIGAGRGTKTVLIQSDSQRRWSSQIPHYVALDNVEFKVSLLKDRAQAYGVTLERVIAADATSLEDLESLGLERGSFDAVLVDAPCSGLGTLRRHPELKGRLTPLLIDEQGKRNLALLSTAASFVASGGIITYATCTITPEENEQVITAFLSSEQGSNFKVMPLLGASSFAPTLRPGSPDAHFAVQLQRKE